MNDSECHEEHQEIKGVLRSVGERIDQADRRLLDHQTEMHRTLVQRTEIEAADKKSHDEIEALAEAILGERRSEILGGGREEKGSLKEKISKNSEMITSIYDDSQNGGIKSKLGKGVVTLLVAMIMALGTLGASLIQHRQDTATLVEKVGEDVMERVDERFNELRQEIMEVQP
jgi:hypothetical protein